MTRVTLPRGAVDWPLEEATIVRAVGASESTGRRTLRLGHARRCRPFALLTWGYRPESTIHSVAIGADEQLFHPVPGSAFPCMLEYAEFERLLDRRADGHDAVRALWRLFSYQGLDLPPVGLGVRFEVELEGPFDHVVFLTKMPVLTESP